jgi:hypothetical protein
MEFRARTPTIRRAVDPVEGREVFVLKAMCIAFLLVAAAGASTRAARPQAPASAPAPAKNKVVQPGLQIALERKLPDGKIEPVASNHVFEPGEVVRFRVTSDFDGYLYVMDQGTSGQFATVFPGTDAGADNRVHQGQSFSIPVTDGSWFQISGPPGFDVLYFLLSPAPLATPPASAFVAPGPVSSLTPRCNDAAFRARGECTDISAGPAALPRNAPLPAPIAPIAGMASRDITVVKKQDQVTVGSNGSRTAPVIYTFRLAHH